MFHVAVIQEYWHDFWHFFLSEPCFSQDSIFCCRFMASLWLAARHFHLFDVICCEMPHIPWRLASICYSHLYFSFSLSGSGDFFPCASNRPPILPFICSLTSPFVQTRRLFKSSDTKLNGHFSVSYTFILFHLQLLICFLSPLFPLLHIWSQHFWFNLSDFRRIFFFRFLKK